MALEVRCRDAGMDCDFMVRSENESELIEFVQQHARDAHGMDIRRADVRDMLTEA
ncbi:MULTISPECIES: DUF1059 domain-containing protein [Salinibaculum]|uniref:DUF1059 domain-containing protein n=1 Tax=Salinibaculum TaxID=2732368 RepID=UPI0030CE4B16